ncbi:PepSY domain-containing protein [Phyllobacterium lublinensis]|uniref:PepSY domain-containing protein n=1 Tax=Phyllobacterium lublinensis TaxID=2875708 RepID=UPI001CCC6E31|nr:PepSY domain-containing protein [Phyllobacterium sp. 2063]MBZ9653530.1 PepSY domain-containing protein [Phyllobacterium sp. 2063]
MKRIVLALAAMTLITTASAQDATKPSTDAQTPAVATPDTQNPAAPVAGENSFTEGQAKERIEAKGYTDVTALTKGEDGIWTGTAMKSGKPFEVKLDFQGNITEAAK